MLYGYLFGYKRENNVDVDVKCNDVDVKCIDDLGNLELDSESELNSDTDSKDQNETPVEFEKSGDQENNYYFEHLEHVKESYWEHFKHSMTYAFLAAKCSFFFIVHAFWPDLFQHSGSDTILHLTNKMSNRKQ
jgi:hypothetical protein